MRNYYPPFWSIKNNENIPKIFQKLYIIIQNDTLLSKSILKKINNILRSNYILYNKVL